MSEKRPALTDLAKQWKAAYKDDIMVGQQPSGGFRFSSGVVAYDLALGGGFKAGAWHLIVGPESSSKTTLCLKTAAEVQKTNWDTGELDLSYSNPCPVIWIDLENTFDPDWASMQGVVGIEEGEVATDAFVLVSPSHGPMMIDIVDDIIASHAGSLIVIDSLESVMSIKESENSAEDSAGLGDRARVLNQAFRKWITTARKTRRESPWQNTTLLYINQLRDKITFMGDPREIPGGKGQRFYASTITFLKKGKLVTEKAKEFGMGTFGGVVEKNKTAQPKRTFEFEMATVNVNNSPPGYVDNITPVWNTIKSHNDLCFKNDNKKWEILGEEYRIQTDFTDKLAEPEFYDKAMKIAYERSRA